MSIFREKLLTKKAGETTENNNTAVGQNVPMDVPRMTPPDAQEWKDWAQGQEVEVDDALLAHVTTDEQNTAVGQNAPTVDNASESQEPVLETDVDELGDIMLPKLGEYPSEQAQPRESLPHYEAKPIVTVLEAPEIDVPTIGDAAVVVQLNFSQWTARRLDRKVTGEIAEQKDAARKAGNYNKHLLPDCHELAAVGKFVSEVRNKVKDMTMPYLDGGLRLLPTSKLAEFHQYITWAEQEFWRLVELFFDAYDFEVAKSQARGTALGEMYDERDYPSLEQVKKKFDISIAYLPVPETWASNLANEAISIIGDHHREFMRDTLTQVQNSTFERLYPLLVNMVESLDYEVTYTRNKKGELIEDKPRFHGTLVTNITDLVALMGDFNLTGDPQMEACRQRLGQALRGVSSTQLKESETLRQRTRLSVQAVLDDYSDRFTGGE